MNARSSVAAVAGLIAFSWAVAAGAGGAVPGFSKSFEPSTIGPGSTATLVYVIDGSAIPSPVTALAFTESLPAGLVIASPSRLATTCLDATVTGSPGASTVSLSGGRLSVASLCLVTVDVTAAAADTYESLSGDLTSSAGNSGAASATLTVDANLPGFRAAFAPSTVAPGAQSTVSFEIDNTANTNAISTLSFGANLPAGLVVASPANAFTDCGAPTLPASVTADPGSRELGLFANGFLPSFPALLAGELCVVSVDVESSMSGSFELVSSDLLAGGLSAGNTVTSLEVERTELQKLFVDDPVLPGETIELQYTLTNLDRFDAATSIAFSDDLDAALAGLAVTGALPPAPCGAGSVVSGGSTVAFVGGSLGPGESCTFALTLTVPPSAAPGNYSSTSSAATLVKGGEAELWDAAIDHLRVADNPFAFTKTFLDDPIGAGSTTSVRYSITNLSSTLAASEISFSDEFAPPFGFPVSYDPFPTNPCGAGSLLGQVQTGTANDEFGIQLSGGSLAADAVCEFEVTFRVPVDFAAGIFELETSPLTATVDGSAVLGRSAAAVAAVVAAPLVFTAEFIDDPAESPDTATLQFVLVNESEASDSITELAFTDDLTLTLAGLSVASLAPDGFCGSGSQMTGTTTLAVSGVELAAGESCVFEVELSLPAGATPGSYTNQTSDVSANVNGFAVNAPPAEAELMITGLAFSMEFVDDPVVPGDTVTLQYTIENLTSSSPATAIFFTHSLSETLSQLVVTGSLPTNPCGAGSTLGTSGPAFLFLQGGNLVPGATCSFSATLEVPGMAAPDSYRSTTSALTATFGGSVAFSSATDLLHVAFAPNDLCLESTIVDDASSLDFSDTQDTTLATADGSDPTPACGMGADGATVWYSFFASENRTILVSTAGSDYDTVVSVWEGSEDSCGSLDMPVACNDDFDDGEVTSLAEFDAVAGTAYLIQVGARNAGAGGELVLQVPEPRTELLAATALLVALLMRRRSATRRGAGSPAASAVR